jgi:hypothetical protein
MSSICAVLLLAHAARAELYVNCMGAEDSNPLGMGCHSVNQDVLHMLDYCSAPSDDNIQGWKMKYVGRLVDYTKPTSTRLLRSREEHQLQNHRREQSEERDLKSSCGYCCHTGLSAGGRMACCLYGGNQYSLWISNGRQKIGEYQKHHCRRDRQFRDPVGCHHHARGGHGRDHKAVHQGFQESSQGVCP